MLDAVPPATAQGQTRRRGDQGGQVRLAADILPSTGSPTPSMSETSFTPTPSSPLQGSCHCGAVRLTLPSRPEKATRCNCSICRRLGGLWVYFAFGSVSIAGHPEHTDVYIWGNRTLRTVRCRICGVATHWEPLAPQPGDKHGVNLNNFDPALVQTVTVRHFDGADTWTFLN